MIVHGGDVVILSIVSIRDVCGHIVAPVAIDYLKGSLEYLLQHVLRVFTEVLHMLDELGSVLAFDQSAEDQFNQTHQIWGVTLDNSGDAERPHLDHSSLLC